MIIDRFHALPLWECDIQGLILSESRDAFVYGQAGEEFGDPGFTRSGRMAFVVEETIASYPVETGFFRGTGIAGFFMNRIQKQFIF